MDFICKDYYTALKSLSDVIGISQSEIVSVLKFDWDKKYEEEYNAFIQSDLPEDAFTDDFGEYILSLGFSQVKITKERPIIHWFHGTRAINPDEYLKYGILPLSQMYPKIKNIIDDIASIYDFKPTNNISELQRHNKWLAEMKLNDPYSHGGPFAMLMYDAIAKPKIFGNHSYIEEPEIISNYAYMTYDKDADIILKEYKAMSLPIIIEFVEPNVDDLISIKILVTTVIHYLYRIIHKDEMSINCNICFSNKGLAISSDQIVEIHKL